MSSSSPPLKKKSYMGQHQIKRKNSFQALNRPPEGDRLLQKIHHLSDKNNISENTSKDNLMGGGTEFLPGESTLGLDEEMLQVLDAVDTVKHAANNTCPTTVNRDAQEESASSAAFAPSRSLAPAAHNKRERNRPLQPSDQGTHTAPVAQEGMCGRNVNGKRPADCRDIVLKLLFSEDSEEGKEAQRDPEKGQSLAASLCISKLSRQGIKNSQQAGNSTM
nr:uncharacterized protein LOC109974148 [Monopterus albus]